MQVYRSGKLVKKEQVSLPETKTQIEGILREVIMLTLFYREVP